MNTQGFADLKTALYAGGEGLVYSNIIDGKAKVHKLVCVPLSKEAMQGLLYAAYGTLLRTSIPLSDSLGTNPSSILGPSTSLGVFVFPDSSGQQTLYLQWKPSCGSCKLNETAAFTGHVFTPSEQDVM